jgi:hypothetical protein
MSNDVLERTVDCPFISHTLIPALARPSRALTMPGKQSLFTDGGIGAMNPNPALFDALRNAADAAVTDLFLEKLPP